MTPPRASVPKPSRRVTKKMWGVFLLGDRLMEVQDRKNPLPDMLKQRGFSIRPVLVTYTTPGKRAKGKNK